MKSRLRRARQAVVAVASLASASAACTRPSPRSHTIVMRDFAFTPAEVEAAQGDTIVWSNADFVPHTATATDAAWDSKSIDGSGTWRFVTREPGRHQYHCAFHPTMKATLVVR